MNRLSTESIPLFIGIVGHRDIADEDKPRLKKLIKQVLEEKKSQCPNTQVIVLSPLAEGADRLAAYSAMECGLSFIAILPMPLSEYRMEFKTDQSLQEFNELFSKASSYCELPSQLNPQKEHKIKISERDDLFYNLGYFMCKMSHLLIALWDGKVNNKTGGTANIVSMKINGIPVAHPFYRPRLRYLQTGPVCHILTPRKGQIIPANAFEIKMLYGDRHEQNQAVPDQVILLKNIDSFNSDIRKYWKNKNTNDVPHDSGGFSNSPSGNQNVFEYYKIADALATHYQSRRFRALKLLLILAVVAFIFFQIYVEFWDNPLILLMYPVTIGIGAIWFMWANRLRFEQKHEDYRALSEAFRVQYYVSMTKNEADVSDYYLQKHEGELEWVTYILRAIHFMNYKNSADDKIVAEGKDNGSYMYIKDHWVKEQALYYRVKGEEYDRHVRNIKFAANGLFIGAILASIILFLMSVLMNGHADSHSGVMHSLLILLTHTFLVTSATLFGYNEKMIFEEQSKTYHQMFRLFSIADQELSRAIKENNYEEAREIIRELGFESLMENADWLLLHRSRPMEIPKG